jgi:hypothetical protein
MTQLANDWLPKPIILHPWPSDRFAVTLRQDPNKEERDYELFQKGGA